MQRLSKAQQRIVDLMNDGARFYARKSDGKLQPWLYFNDNLRPADFKGVDARTAEILITTNVLVEVSSNTNLNGYSTHVYELTPAYRVTPAAPPAANEPTADVSAAVSEPVVLRLIDPDGKFPEVGFFYPEAHPQWISAIKFWVTDFLYQNEFLDPVSAFSDGVAWAECDDTYPVVSQPPSESSPPLAADDVLADVDTVVQYNDVGDFNLISSGEVIHHISPGERDWNKVSEGVEGWKYDHANTYWDIYTRPQPDGGERLPDSPRHESADDGTLVDVATGTPQLIGTPLDMEYVNYRAASWANGLTALSQTDWLKEQLTDTRELASQRTDAMKEAQRERDAAIRRIGSILKAVDETVEMYLHHYGYRYDTDLQNTMRTLRAAANAKPQTPAVSSPPIAASEDGWLTADEAVVLDRMPAGIVGTIEAQRATWVGGVDFNEWVALMKALTSKGAIRRHINADDHVFYEVTDAGRQALAAYRQRQQRTADREAVVANDDDNGRGELIDRRRALEAELNRAIRTDDRSLHELTTRNDLRRGINAIDEQMEALNEADQEAVADMVTYQLTVSGQSPAGDPFEVTALAVKIGYEQACRLSDLIEFEAMDESEFSSTELKDLERLEGFGYATVGVRGDWHITEGGRIVYREYQHRVSEQAKGNQS